MDDFELGYRLGYAAGYDIGYGRAEHDIEQAWIPVARQVRELGRPTMSPENAAHDRVRAAESESRRMALRHWDEFLARYPTYEAAADAVAAR